MKATIKDGNIVITMPLFAPPHLSTKKKSMLVASTGGAVALANGEGNAIKVDGKPIVFSGNVYYDART